MLLAFMCLTTSLWAQDFMFEFAKPDGTIIPDGSVVEVTAFEKEEDPGTGEVFVMMNSGLFARRTNASESQEVRMAYTVERMDNGDMQICFPSVCSKVSSVASGATKPGTLFSTNQPLATEWFPTEYGTCTLKARLEAVEATSGGNYKTVDAGPTITIRFVYADPAHVTATAMIASPVAYYTLGGQRVSTLHHGVNVVRMSDGRILKRIVR